MNLQKLFDEAQTKRNNGQIEDAVSDYQQTRTEALKTGEEWLATESLHMIGVAYYQAEQYSKAEKFLIQAKEEFAKLNDKDLVGAVLRDLGLVARKEKDLSKAKKLLEESIAYLKGNLGHLGMSQVKLGMVLSEEGNFSEAEEKVKEGIKNIQNSPERFFEALAWMNLGEVQKMTGKIKESKLSLLQAQSVLDSISSPYENQSLRKQIKELLKDYLL